MNKLSRYLKNNLDFLINRNQIIWPHYYLFFNIAIIGLIFVYLAVNPLLPSSLAFNSSHQSTPPLQTDLLNFASNDNSLQNSSDDAQILTNLPPAQQAEAYRIFIPKIKVDMNIVLNETNEQRAFSRGAWHLPGTAAPNSSNGNVVIAAHRFLFTSGPRTFYHLDKLKTGDPIAIRWDNQDFIYHVVDTKIVPPSAVEILKPSAEPMLTLFTCDPVFTSKNRLVVVAKLTTAPVINN